MMMTRRSAPGPVRALGAALLAVALLLAGPGAAEARLLADQPRGPAGAAAAAGPVQLLTGAEAEAEAEAHRAALAEAFEDLEGLEGLWEAAKPGPKMRCKRAFMVLKHRCKVVAMAIEKAVKAGKLKPAEGKKKLAVVKAKCKAAAEKIKAKCSQFDGEIDFGRVVRALERHEERAGDEFAFRVWPLWGPEAEDKPSPEEWCKKAFGQLKHKCEAAKHAVRKAVEAGKISKEDGEKKIHAIEARCKKGAEMLKKKCTKTDQFFGRLFGAFGELKQKLFEENPAPAAWCKKAFGELKHKCEAAKHAVRKAVEAGKITKEVAEKEIKAIEARCKKGAEMIHKRCPSAGDESAAAEPLRLVVPKEVR